MSTSKDAPVPVSDEAQPPAPAYDPIFNPGPKRPHIPGEIGDNFTPASGDGVPGSGDGF